MKKNLFLSAMSAFALAFLVVALVSCGSKAKEEEEEVEAEALRSDYIAEINKWAAEYPDSTTAEFCGYFVYDLNGDKIPELWIKGGTCEADRKLGIYSYDLDGMITLYEEDAPHFTLYQGDDYVLYFSANNGEVLENKLTYDGDSIKVEKVYEGPMDDSAGFKDPTEPMIDFIPYSNLDVVDNVWKEDLKDVEKVEEVE